MRHALRMKQKKSYDLISPPFISYGLSGRPSRVSEKENCIYPGMYAKIVFSASRWTPIVSKQAH
jgi:hypothetical protein